MSEWDKLWNMWGMIMYYINKTPLESDLKISILVSTLRDIKAEGDRMQTEGDQMQSHIHHVDYENTLLKAEIKEIKFQRMRDNSDRLLTDRLDEITLIKQENDGLRDRVYELEQLVRVHKLTDAEQKLEAIRGLIPKLKCDRCISWVGEPCPETCGYLIFKKIIEVLGDE